MRPETHPDQALIYFDSNSLDRLIYADKTEEVWRNFYSLFGGYRKTQGKGVSPLMSVLQTSELMGLKPPNAQISWKRPKASSEEIYNAAFGHARKIYREFLDPNDIENRFQEMESKLKPNPMADRVRTWLDHKPKEPDKSRAEAFINALIEHWAFQFVQISELYTEKIFKEVLPNIYYFAMLKRAEGEDMSVYRAMQKDILMFSKNMAKNEKLKAEERRYYRLIVQQMPNFKDIGDHVDAELLHVAVAGGAADKYKRVLSVTLDQNLDTLHQRIFWALGHYKYIFEATEKNYPDWAIKLNIGWVVALSRDFEVRKIFNIQHDFTSWMDA